VPAARRLFVAVAPPDPVRRRITAIAEELRRASGPAAAELRWVAPENVHVTLQFLGAVPVERVQAVQEAVRAVAAAGRPLGLEVKGAGGFPSARRPRVIWLGLAGDVAALAGLAAGLGGRLAPLGFPPEERAFSPHLTLARARDARGIPGLAGALAQAGAAEPVAWRVPELVLEESHLSPRGARYEVIDRAPLGG
jgi:2'-5' RNA ligase